ncbi:DUF6463 family protein [Glycomyces sp. NPDC021274]|jgi:hypothetical protein|uniref:DUF6463 family protein n=1 Tax=Glycomyces sp. NPDC021274 TaxID=3155120 RepID=UPI0033DD4DE0
MIKTAGWFFVVLGGVHTALSLGLFAAKHFASWFSGGLWRSEGGFADMTAAMAAYWFSLASFGVPLLVLGLTVLWTLRRGLVPPAFLGWILLVWTVVNMAVLLLSPWVLGVAGSVLYLVGVRRANREQRPAVPLEASR